MVHMSSSEPLNPPWPTMSWSPPWPPSGFISLLSSIDNTTHVRVICGSLSVIAIIFETRTVWLRSHHSEFIFCKKQSIVPTDGAKLLEQFSVRWRVDLWFVVFFIICKEEQTMRQREGLPTSPLRCLSQWAILESIESREFSIFSAYI